MFNYYLYLILMILSNFVLFLIYNKNQCADFLLQQKNQITHNIVLTNRSIKMNQILIATSNQYFQKPLESYYLSHSYDKLVSRNLWQKLINEYIQETVFLSSVNKFNIHYVNKLKSMGLSVYDSSQYRIFLNKFSKDLIHGRVNISHKNYNDFLINELDNKSNSSVKYIWIKLLNLDRLNLMKFKNIFFNIFNQSLVPLVNNSLPLFILVNNNDEIIMSESVDQLVKFSNRFNFYRMLNFELFNNKKNYTCLLFVNHDDALEYRNHIYYKNRKSTRLLDIKIIPSNINLYNKLKQVYIHKVDFRLIPDLKEISTLLNKYSKYRNVSFQINQKYGYKFFQGQPLYQIQSFRIKNTNKVISDPKQLYFFKNIKKYSNLNTYFLNYDTALNVWKQMLKENVDTKLPSSPQILVSNLESFIQTKQDESLTFLPSIENYVSIKKYIKLNSKSHNIFTYTLSNQRIYIKTLCYRIFWSLTSRHPHDL